MNKHFAMGYLSLTTIGVIAVYVAQQICIWLNETRWLFQLGLVIIILAVMMFLINEWANS